MWWATVWTVLASWSLLVSVNVWLLWWHRRNLKLHCRQLRWRWASAGRNRQLPHADICWIAAVYCGGEVSLWCILMCHEGLLCTVWIRWADVSAVWMVGYGSFWGGLLISFGWQIQVYILWICVLVCEAVGCQAEGACAGVVELVGWFTGSRYVLVVLGWSSLGRFVYVGEWDRC